MPAKTLVVILDSGDIDLIRRWSDSGHLPTFARLIGDSRCWELQYRHELIPDGILPMIYTGLPADRLGIFYPPAQIHTGESVARRIDDSFMDPERCFWTIASRAGQRAAIIDLAFTIPARDFNGLQLHEWGLHDELLGLMSSPPELKDDIVAHHGRYPLPESDTWAAHGAYAQLVDKWHQAVPAKTGVILDILGREVWDLFVCGWSEQHGAGHQLWHFQDSGHPWYDASAQETLKHGLRNVYRDLDAGLGRVIDAAGPGSAIVVIATHGMRDKCRSMEHLPAVLNRLGYGPGKQARIRLGYAVPKWLRKYLRRLVPRRAYQELMLSARSRHTRFGPGAKALAPFNTWAGAIRLNLMGREPQGTVAPGLEAEQILAALKREIAALRDPETGESVVMNIATPREVFGDDFHPDLPDLLIDPRRDLGRLEEVESPTLGRFSLPNPNPRSGDHYLKGGLWVRAAGGGSGPAGPLDLLDIAPSILELAGVALPDSYPGRARFGSGAANSE